MRDRRRFEVALTVVGFSFVTLVAAAEPTAAGTPPLDPLAAELEHWSSFLEKNAATDDTWKQVKEESAPILEKAEQALRDGRRLLALERLAVVRPDLAASEYVSRLPKGNAGDMIALEAEWKRTRGELGVSRRSALSGASFALARAEGEVALNQVHGYYASSLDYARATMADFGYFYLGAALGQRQFARVCAKLPAPAALPEPPVRSIAGEIDALNRELLAAYVPPASIDRHKEFIVASSLLKEGRELDAAGLRYGALLRYLEAALRAAPLRQAAPSLDAKPLAARLDAFDRRLAGAGVDHTIGRLFLESARADVASAKPGETPALAEAIATDVIPRYLAALEPAKPGSPAPPVQTTVTLVRWPYT